MTAPRRPPVFCRKPTTAMAILFSPATTPPAPDAHCANIQRARELLQSLTMESYRFFATPDGPIIRPAGAYPKLRPSDYASDDARDLQEILMTSDDVHALVNMASNLGFSLHLLDVTFGGEVVFAKEKPGVLFGDVDHVTAKL